MSQENVEIVRRLNEAFNRGDLKAGLELLDPGFEWTLTPTPEPAGYCAGDVAGERALQGCAAFP